MAGSAFRCHFDGDSMSALCYDLKVNNEEAYVCSVGSTQVNADIIFDVFVLRFKIAEQYANLDQRRTKKISGRIRLLLNNFGLISWNFSRRESKD